jgi:multiple sugar transport system substrate-binding protein
MRPSTLLLVLVCGFLVSAGCGGSQRAGGGSGASGSGKIRLTYWVTPEVKEVPGMEAQTPEFGDYERLLAKQYTKAHPNVEIEVQALASEELTKKVTTSIAAGSPPDLLKDYLGRTSGYAYQDLVEDFTQALPAEEKADYDPFYVKLYTINGKLHGLPMYAWATHVILNRAAWKSAGKTDLLPAEDGNGDWTYDQFLTAMRALAVPGKVWPWWAQFASEQGDYTNHGFFWGRGAFMYQPGDYSRVTINTPAGVESLQMLVDMAKEGLMPPGATTMANSELENMIGRGQSAAWGDSLFAFLRMQVAKREGRISVPLKLQIAQFPHAAGKKTPLPVGPTGIIVFKQADSRKREAAMQLARWLNSPDFQSVACQTVHQFPTRKSTVDRLKGDRNYQLVRKWLAENGKVDLGLTSPNYYKVRVAAVPHFQAALLGQKTPAQALKDFETEASAILKR